MRRSCSAALARGAFLRCVRFVCCFAFALLILHARSDDKSARRSIRVVPPPMVRHPACVSAARPTAATYTNTALTDRRARVNKSDTSQSVHNHARDKLHHSSSFVRRSNNAIAAAPNDINNPHNNVIRQLSGVGPISPARIIPRRNPCQNCDRNQTQRADDHRDKGAHDCTRNALVIEYNPLPDKSSASTPAKSLTMFAAFAGSSGKRYICVA